MESSRVADWVKRKKHRSLKIGTRFESAYSFLQKEIKEGWASVLDQERLPFNTKAALERVESKLQESLEAGNEGIVLRNHYSVWLPERSRNLLKHKPYHDDEAKVIGYVWGRGKYHGMMGCLRVLWKGKVFELSGMTDEERKLLHNGSEDIARDGEECEGGIQNPLIPLKSIVTFRYRELSDDGIPKEARYKSVRNE
jgi:DNA ligase-1